MTSTPTILVSTWSDGVFAVTGKKVERELADRSVRSLAADGRGNVLAIAGRHSLFRRSPDGEWTEIARSEFELSCCVSIGESILIGTNDARVLRVDRDGLQQCLTDFATTPGRDQWYAGSAVVDGKLMGPPLGIRSLTATCDGAVLMANVHVGGIPRSIDDGRSWLPTIDIDSDVHQVRAHPARPDTAIAASAAGLCTSRDAGATWTIEQQGLPAHYCSAVAFGRNDIFVAASTGHFATHGAVYRRPIDGNGPLQPLGGGMPERTSGIVDTDCIATRDSTVAVIDGSGRLYVSHDDGASWSDAFDRLPVPSGLHIC